jgi:hypothetical protein
MTNRFQPTRSVVSRPDHRAVSGVKDLIRAQGIDLFIWPIRRKDRLWGQAALHCDKRKLIEMYMPWRDLRLAHILAHELAHHDLGHTVKEPDFQPHWRLEYEAEMRALEILAPWCSYHEIAQLEDWSRDHIRPKVQDYLDDGIWVHGEVDVGIWAGCGIDNALFKET